MVENRFRLLEDRDELIQGVFKVLPLFPQRKGMWDSSSNGLSHFMRLLYLTGPDVFAASSDHLTDLSEDDETFFGAQNGKVLNTNKRLHDFETKALTDRGLFSHFIGSRSGGNTTTSGRVE